MQLKLGSFGEVLEGLEDINQEIMLILTTPLGSIPHRPEFGSKIYEYLDKPVDIAKPLIIAETFRAIRTNSSRFYPTKVIVESINSYEINFRVIGRLDKNTERTIELSFLADFAKGHS